MSRTLAINHQYLYFKLHKKHVIKRINEAPRKTPFFTVVYIKQNEDNKATNINTKQTNNNTAIYGNYSIPKKHHNHKQSNILVKRQVTTYGNYSIHKKHHKRKQTNILVKQEVNLVGRKLIKKTTVNKL